MCLKSLFFTSKKVVNFILPLKNDAWVTWVLQHYPLKISELAKNWPSSGPAWKCHFRDDIRSKFREHPILSLRKPHISTWCSESNKVGLDLARCIALYSLYTGSFIAAYLSLNSLIMLDNHTTFVYLPFFFCRDPEKDLVQLNSERNCCICLEDFSDEKGNPIIPGQDKTNDSVRAVVGYSGANEEDQQGQVNEAFQSESSGKEKRNSAVETEDGITKTVDETDLVLGLLVCGHLFHFECIWKWMQSRTKCPICRKYNKMSPNDIKAVSYEAVYCNEDNENVKGKTFRPKLRRDVHSIEEQMKRKSDKATSVVGKIRERAQSGGNKKDMKGEKDKICRSISDENGCQTKTVNQESFADNVIEMIRERASSIGSNKGFTELRNENDTEEPRSRLGSFGNFMEKIRARASSTGSRDKYDIKRQQICGSQTVEVPFQSEENVSRPRLTSFGSKNEHEKITEEKNEEQNAQQTSKKETCVVTLNEWKMKS